MDKVIPMEDIDFVLLDMDGTLLDKYFDDYFWEHLVPEKYAEKHNITFGKAKEELMKKYKVHEGTLNLTDLDFWSTELSLDIPALKEQIKHLIEVHPHVEDFLHMLKKKKKKAFLVTNAHYKSIELKFRKTRIGKHFKGDGTFSQTTPILGGAITDDKTFEVAAVFDPVDEMVRLYSTYQHHICSAYSQNGVNWSGAGCVYPYSAHGLSAVYYQGIVNDKPYDTIVSFEDNLGQDFLYYLKGMGSGMLVDQYIIPDAAHRPSLVNLNHDPTGEVAMIYKSSNDADSSMIRKLGTNGVWSASTKLGASIPSGRRSPAPSPGTTSR